MKQQLGENRLLTSMGPTWKRPDDLTTEQNALLDELNFPKKVEFPNVLQKNIVQEKNGKFYVLPTGKQQKQRVVYTTLSYKAAALRHPYPDDSKSPEDKAAILETAVDLYQKSPVVSNFIDRNHIQEEMESILKYLTPPVASSVVRTPAETPVKNEDKQEEETKQEEQEEPNTPQLANVHKAKVKQLLADGYDAGEIAEELGKPVEMVISYIEKLNQ